VIVISKIHDIPDDVLRPVRVYVVRNALIDRVKDWKEINRYEVVFARSTPLSKSVPVHVEREVL